MEWLGHADSEMVRHYYHLHDAESRQQFVVKVLATQGSGERLEQAAQNQRMAESTQRLAQGSQQLIDADAKARRELIQMQNGLRQDQAELAKQRDALEIARAEVAEDRLTDSQVANCIIAVGVLIAAVAPLVLAGISLVGLWREPTREEEGHVLIEELTRELVADQVPPAEH